MIRAPQPRARPWALRALGMTACAAAPTPTHVAPQSLLASIRQGDAPVIVDVRTRREYDRGHVPGAFHIPFYKLPVRAHEILGSREQPVVVYCELGPRAAIAKLGLRMAGFTDVRYLEGHMAGWRARGLPMETPTATR